MLGNDVQLLNAPYPIFCNPSFNTGALKYIYIYILTIYQSNILYQLLYSLMLQQ